MTCPNVSVIIPAAGYGVRMGTDKRKPYLEIGGEEIIFKTLTKFQHIENLLEIILVVNPEDIERIKSEWQQRLGELQVKRIIPGGKVRAESVKNAIDILDEKTEVVLIHDAVRPFISEKVINDVIESSMKDGAAIAAAKVKDTVKKADELTITDTVDRESLWLAQTPQGFRMDVLKKMYENIDLEDKNLTDDAFLAEKANIKVNIIPDSPFNFKITTPEDLELAKRIAR